VLILLDNNVPRGLARALTGHTVTEARERGWATLRNGELLTIAEEAGFEVLVTSDKNIRRQQNLQGRKIALVVLNPGALGTGEAQAG
jgi:predicted nuclease of predicted toxin-antitoxin system